MEHLKLVVEGFSRTFEKFDGSNGRSSIGRIISSSDVDDDFEDLIMDHKFFGSANKNKKNNNDNNFSNNKIYGEKEKVEVSFFR